jgi:hypothetical protein
MTIKNAKNMLRALGYTLSHRDGEFRVAPIDGTPATREARAYYTDDLDDAISTVRCELSRKTAMQPAPVYTDTVYGTVPMSTWIAYRSATT